MILAIHTPLSISNDVKDVFIAADRYAIVVTSGGTNFGGVEIIDLYTQNPVSSGIVPNPPISVAAEATLSGSIFIGTVSSGVLTVPYYTAINHPNFTQYLYQRFTTTSTPPITSNTVLDLDTQTNRIFISTAAGVDFITHYTLRAFRLLAPGSDACQVTATGAAYWSVTNSGVEVNYDLFPSSGTGIISVDFEYNTVDSFPRLPPSCVVTDIAVAPGVPNTLSFATSVGNLVIQEVPGAEASSPVKIFASGTNTVSTDFSDDAVFNDNFLYSAEAERLDVFDLENNTTSGTHTSALGTRDQVLLSGTISVVRTTSVA